MSLYPMPPVLKPDEERRAVYTSETIGPKILTLEPGERLELTPEGAFITTPIERAQMSFGAWLRRKWHELAFGKDTRINQ